jgi:hypothetical protein
MKACSARAITLALPAALATLTLGLAACQEQGDAPWLTMPSDEDHAARFFPITSGSVHGALTCNDCHGETGGFGAYDCLHCHTGAHANEAEVAAIHAGDPNFRWESAACLGCHRNGIGVDHEAIFPIAAGPHTNAECTQCHVQPGDRSVLGCAGCHPHTQAAMDDKHRGEPGYVFESRTCLGCHPRGQKEDG